jgi:hypothetical protein
MFSKKGRGARVKMQLKNILAGRNPISHVMDAKVYIFVNFFCLREQGDRSSGENRLNDKEDPPIRDGT